MHVCLVEDDPLICRAVDTALREGGHTCTCFHDGQEAIDAHALAGCDAAVLDVMLPGASGLDVLRVAREQGVRTPVIMLTALGATPEKLRAFEKGADDYLVKPFDTSELLARLDAMHRRAAYRPTLELVAGPLHLSLATKRVSLNGRQIDLTPTELSILEMLMRYKGQVVTRTMLCEHIWGFRWDGPTNVIEVHITRIRGKLDHDRQQSLIRTIRGRGYALAGDAAE
jgi:two-component system OmpR family response regulator